MSFTLPEPPFDSFRDPDAQRDVVASVFAGDQWEIPRMTAAMRTADDLFFDVVGQIHMPRWSSEALAERNDALRGLTSLPSGTGRPERSALTLPAFATAS